ncbi:hypothetical protein C8F04DRAFT_1264316 [Mycena alexandri]|uniref:Uncharacterized protein n=1 Tax=Mycena alexandri TaxID=1745969 RepID=A0AAD6WWH1_9AGAR|nr:hypothetical protein C8F04DRAFT_1264316 [Mycena alexandri]
MPSATQRCGDDEERHLRRLATYRQNLEERRAKGREQMACLRAAQNNEAKERHREAQRRYRERYREQIAHRARRATVQRNAEAGKETKLRPKARQYWSDPDLATDEEDEDEGDDW